MVDVTDISDAVVLAQAERLSSALEAIDFCGWDPYDALSSPPLRVLARGALGRRAAIQVLKRSPINLRRLAQVPPHRHTKALALCVSAYVRLALATGADRYRQLAISLARDLASRGMASHGGTSWAYDFDVQTRWGFYRAGEPNAVVTAFAAHALLDVHMLAVPHEEFERLAHSAARFTLDALLVETRQNRFFAYYPGSRTLIHNANLLVAGVLARCNGTDEDARLAARDAVALTLAHQQADGAWPYGLDGGLGWIDGYHTAYILVSLRHYLEMEASDEGERSLELGLRYYVSRLFEQSGAPRATSTSLYPIDIHGASSAIWALSTLNDRSSEAEPLARRVLAWTLLHMQRGDGRFAFQLHARYRNSVPYVRWNDAHMLLAMASLLRVHQGEQR